MRCVSVNSKYRTDMSSALKPGGWSENVDLICATKSDHGPIPEDSAVKRWTDLVAEGAMKMGRTMLTEGVDCKAIMEEVGFVNIEVKPFKIPIGTWPADPVLKEAGANQLVGMLDGIQSLSLAIFTRVLGWTQEEVEVLLMHARSEFKKKKNYRYWSGWVVYGQKPKN